MPLADEIHRPRRLIMEVSADGGRRNLRSGQALPDFLKGHGAPVQGSAFSPDGRTLVTVGSDGNTVLWDVRTRKRLGTTLPAPVQNALMSVAFAPEGRPLIVAYGDDGQALRWDVDRASWAARACEEGRSQPHQGRVRR